MFLQEDYMPDSKSLHCFELYISMLFRKGHGLDLLLLLLPLFPDIDYETRPVKFAVEFVQHEVYGYLQEPTTGLQQYLQKSQDGGCSSAIETLLLFKKCLGSNSI